MFTTFLSYKLLDEGKLLIRIDKWFPSSKTCSSCNHVKKKLDLSERSWTCSNCNTVHDRDINAAINIRNEGIKIITRTAGTAGLAYFCLDQ